MEQCKKCINYEFCNSLGFSIKEGDTCDRLMEKDKWIYFPCNLGDDVYVIEDGGVWKGTLERIILSRTNKVSFEVYLSNGIIPMKYEPQDIGKRVFLNEIEANERFNLLIGKESSKKVELVCKYEQDEICVNDQCPMCADYCPVPNTCNVCKHEERVER